MRYSEETIQNIIKLREQGKGVSEISRILSLDRDAVSRNLKKRGYSTERNPLHKSIFHIIDSEEKAYWLGFLYADGYVSKYNQIEVSLQPNDVEHLKKLKKFVNTNTPIIQEKTRCRLLFCSKEMTADLADKGCINNKSLVLTFPNQQQVPDEYLRHFIRGYVDGDGCICCTNKTKQLSITSTKDFLEGMMERTGWDSNLCDYYPSGKAYTWRCSTLKNKEYLDYMYKDCSIYLNRKYEKYKLFTAD